MHPHTRLLGFLERYTKTDLAYFARSGFWGNLSTASVTLFSLALYYVFANYVSRETFGTYQYLLALGALLGVLTFTGMNTAVTTAVAKGYDGSLRQAMRLQLRYAFVPLFAAGGISAYYFIHGNVLLGWGALIVGLLTPLLNAGNTYSAFLQGKQDFMRVFLYNFWINVPFYGFLMYAALQTENALILVAIALGMQALGCFVALKKAESHYLPTGSEDPSLVRYGTHLSIMGALGLVAFQADTLLAFHYLGATGLAVYVFAVAAPERLGGLVKFIPMAALPRFSTRSFFEARRGLLSRLPLTAVALLLIAGTYVIAAPYLFSLLFPTYVDAIPYSQWYAVSIIAVLTQLLVVLLSSHAFVQRLYIYHVATPALQLAFQFTGVVLFGLPGLVLGRLLGIGTAFGIALVLVLTAQEALPR